MSFADYLRHHPKNPPLPPSDEDTKFIINLINDFKFVLTKNSIGNSSANRNIADKCQPIKNVKRNCPHASNVDSIFLA